MTSAPRFAIDLDLPAHERWRELIAAYKPRIHAAVSSIDRDIEKLPAHLRAGVSVGCGLLRAMGAAGSLMYYDDAVAIADLAGLPLGRLLALQLLYEASALCTSVVAPSQRLGAPFLVRTMDWSMPLLAALTVQLHFRRGGRDLFVCSSWVGYIGIFTGMAVRPGGDSFGLAVNYRHTGAETSVAALASGLRSRYPTGFLVRQVLENAVSYDDAVARLRTAKLIAPVYFSVTGSRPNQGCLVTRDRSVDAMFWSLATHGPVVQANNDHWDVKPQQDFMESFARRHFVSSQLGFATYKFDAALDAALAQQQGAGPSKPVEVAAAVGTAMDESMLLLMSEPLVCTDITIYATVMVPAVGYYDTRLPTPLDIVHPTGARQRVFTLFRRLAVPLVAAAPPVAAGAMATA